VGSSRGVAICGVVRACTLQGREHCAGGGVRRQNVAREAHGGFKSLLASRLRPLSSKATHPPNYRSLHRQRLARDTQPLRAIDTAQGSPAHTENVSVLARTCPCTALTHTPTGGFQRTRRLIVAHTRLWHTQSQLWIPHGLGADPRSCARSLTCRHHSAVGPLWSTFTPVPLGGRRNGRQHRPWSAACPPCRLLVAVLPLGMEIGRFHWLLASLPLCGPAAAWLRRCDRKQAVYAPLYSGSCAEFAPALSPFEELSTQQRFFSDPSGARVQWPRHRLRFLRRRHPLPHA